MTASRPSRTNIHESPGRRDAQGNALSTMKVRLLEKDMVR